MNGPYRDLVALIPVRQLGLRGDAVHQRLREHPAQHRLVSDPREWGRFRDWGTTIIEGIDQATQLFKTFDFVNASGQPDDRHSPTAATRSSISRPAGRAHGRRGAHLEDSRAT